MSTIPVPTPTPLEPPAAPRKYSPQNAKMITKLGQSAFFAAFNEYKAAAAVQLADHPEIRQRLGLK